MELDEPLKLNDRIQIIPLAKAGYETIGRANTSGWGLISLGLFPKTPDNLQWLEMNVLPEDGKDTCHVEFQQAYTVVQTEAPYFLTINNCLFQQYP